MGHFNWVDAIQVASSETVLYESDKIGFVCVCIRFLNTMKSIMHLVIYAI